MDSSKITWAKILGGALLVTGTTIGGGILAFPVASGVTGFWPSLALFVLFWFFMLLSAFVLLEVTLRMEGDSDLLSMARYALGPLGTAIGWTSYLFLLYALMTAYTAAASGMVGDFLKTVLSLEVGVWFSALPVILIFGAFVLGGTAAVDRLNRLMMFGLGGTFLLTVLMLLPHVELDRLGHQDLHYLSLTTSVIATAFGFHIIIPALSNYLGRDVRALRLAILIGTSIPLVTYIIWQFAVLGALPIEGSSGLRWAYDEGLPVTHPMRSIFTTASRATILRLFEFCAIITSFLGVALSLSHFLKDGFNIDSKSKRGQLMTWALTFLPPLVITATNPRAFLLAIEYAGTFGVLVLLALLPALMAWSGRRKEKKRGYHAPGGKATLVGLMVFSLCFITLELLRKLGIFN